MIALMTTRFHHVSSLLLAAANQAERQDRPLASTQQTGKPEGFAEYLYPFPQLKGRCNGRVCTLLVKVKITTRSGIISPSHGNGLVFPGTGRI